MNIDSQTLREVREHFGLLYDAPILKDWHVVRAIGALAAIDAAPLRLVFGGGTALARAHKLIRRMSEDVDFKMMPVGDVAVSKSALNRQLGDLRDKVSRALASTGFALDGSMPHTRNERRYMLYQLPYENEGDVAAGLRPTIQVELTYAPLRLEAVRLPVASFITEAFQGPPEVASVECVALTETAAEKLVSLTRRTAMRIAGFSRDDDPTLVRHIYDLHVLRTHYDSSAVAALAAEVIRKDAEIFANQYPAYRDDPLSETHKAMAALVADPVYAERYAAFHANMVYGEPVAFADAVVTLRDLLHILK